MEKRKRSYNSGVKAHKELKKEFEKLRHPPTATSKKPVLFHLHYGNRNVGLRRRPTFLSWGCKDQRDAELSKVVENAYVKVLYMLDLKYQM